VAAGFEGSIQFPSRVTANTNHPLESWNINLYYFGLMPGWFEWHHNSSYIFSTLL